MAYRYADHESWLFSDEGQRAFLMVRDRVRDLLRLAGAFRAQEAMAGFTGNTDRFFAILDRMVVLGEIRSVQRMDIVSQHQVYVLARQT